MQDFQTQLKACVTEVEHNADKHSLLKHFPTSIVKVYGC